MYGLTDIRKMFGGGSCNIPLIPFQDLIDQLTDEQIIAVYEGRIDINIVEFTTVGVHTYTPPSNLLMAYVGAIGGGGGGGSGAARGSGTAMGGLGGLGASIARRWLTPTQIGASQTVTVANGGAGGAAREYLGSQLAGNTGANGGDSSFGSLVIARGGLGGPGGDATSNQQTGAQLPPANETNVPQRFPDSITGHQSTNNSSSGAQTTSATDRGFGSAFIGGAGAAGGSASSTQRQQGGNGSHHYDKDGVLSAVTNGGIGGSGSGVLAGNGGAGHNNYSLQWLEYLGNYSSVGYGTSGAGGGGHITPSNAGGAAGGFGGNGGLYGAGGGGGGGMATGANNRFSGKGGDGAQGAVVVIELLITP
jgi:hypothetical protein